MKRRYHKIVSLDETQRILGQRVGPPLGRPLGVVATISAPHGGQGTRVATSDEVCARRSWTGTRRVRARPDTTEHTRPALARHARHRMRLCSRRVAVRSALSRRGFPRTIPLSSSSIEYS